MNVLNGRHRIVNANDSGDYTWFETAPCMLCNARTQMVVLSTQFRAWINGEATQTAFPDMLESTRETLISGTHASCWEDMFAIEEED